LHNALVSSAFRKVMQNTASRALTGVSCSRRICKCCSGTQTSPEVWQMLVLNLLVNHALCDSPYVAPNTALTCLLIVRSRLVALLV